MQEIHEIQRSWELFLDAAALSLLSAQQCAAAATAAEEFEVCRYQVWDLRGWRGNGEESGGMGWDDVSRQPFSIAPPIPVPSLPAP